ncbi:MAG: hypothetical protein AAFY76_10280, partial [Cyanobacteria bacterium J06649_11]
MLAKDLSGRISKKIKGTRKQLGNIIIDLTGQKGVTECPLPHRRHRIISRKLLNNYLTFKKALLCARVNFQNPNDWPFWPNMMLAR